MIEATAVQPNGRITPEDSGIWLDAHTDMLKQHVQLAHSQNVAVGIQLAHAGRKASTVAPWLSSSAIATRDVGGWPEDVVGTTNERFSEQTPVPRAITLAGIEQLKLDFVLAAQRAVAAGIDVIELHFAHGYLVSSFLTPAVNTRTDAYGGSFENRVRLALEIVEGVRAAIPESTPLFVRISATDWLENNEEYNGDSWTVEDSAKLALLLAERGVDVLDVCVGFCCSGRCVARQRLIRSVRKVVLRSKMGMLLRRLLRQLRIHIIVNCIGVFLCWCARTTGTRG